jgi:hypothetical protein
MPDLLSLSLRAADLATRPARWVIGQIVERVRGEDETPQPEPAPAAAATRPAAPPAPPADPPAPRSKKRAPTRRPSPKQARRATRHEPTRGQAGAIREEQRMAEQNAGGPGPGPTIDVAEPWDGYAKMTEDQILERLVGAEPAVRAIVRLYEDTHGARRQILLATEEVHVEP